MKNVKKLITETIREFSETSKKVSPRLIYLAKASKYYKNFEEFENDYMLKNFHGIYWHLTVDPNFKINPNQVPTDLSSLASGGSSTPGLMVTTHISNWDATFDHSRMFVAQIDLSDLKPNIDYTNVRRGFGHEIFVFKPSGAKVVKVLPIKKALRRNYEDYKSVLPQSSEQLRRIWDLAHANNIKESFIDAKAGQENRYSITKLEEDFAISYLSKKLFPVLIKQFNAITKNPYFNVDKQLDPIEGDDVKITIKSLKKIRDMHLTNMMNTRNVVYKAISPSGTQFIFKISKKREDIVTITYYVPYGNYEEDFDLHPLGEPRGPHGFDTLSEGINDNSEESKPFRISKMDEDKAYSILARRKDNQGNPIGKHLKKIKHFRSDSPYISDKIVYLNTDDYYTFSVEKDADNRLIYYSGFISNFPGTNVTRSSYESSTAEYLTEAADWRGWGLVTSQDKEKLKIALEAWIKRIKNIYSNDLARTKIFLVKKSMDNFEVTDPRFAARPLSHLSMEDRLSLSDFIDHVDTTGEASKAFDLLLTLSREYIKPPKPPKPDITLKKIADMVWPNGGQKSDVYIYGLEDMKPVIGFEFYFGGYSLDKNFIEQFSKNNELYVDWGANVKITNMIEVMARVKKVLDNQNGKIQENVEKTEKSYSISKVEEQEGLDYINRMMIPQLAQPPERVRRGMKKIVHQKFAYDPSGIPRDIIGWEYETKDEYKFTFFLIKLLPNKIAIGYISPGENVTFYIMGSNPVQRFGLFVPQVEKFIDIFRRRNSSMNESIEDDQQQLSKMDEERAVAYINRLNIKGNQVGKKLKKIAEAPSLNPKNRSKTVTYESNMGNVIYTFEIVDSRRLGLLIYAHANGFHFDTYRVDKDKYKFDIR